MGKKGVLRTKSTSLIRQRSSPQRVIVSHIRYTMAVVPILSSAEATAPAPEVASTADWITQQMENVSITPATPPRPVTGTTVRISVPLDATTRSAVYTERKILRRDSIERREALLKGKEGSRQRRRWENGKPTRKGDNCVQVN